jgi:hypothetical protein
MSARRKGPGRPPFLWHGPKGQAFLYAVFKVQIERHPIKTVDAILAVLRRPEFADLKKQYGNRRRYLEKQYLSAKKFWSQARVRIREIEKPARAG